MATAIRLMGLIPHSHAIKTKETELLFPLAISMNRKGRQERFMIRNRAALVFLDSVQVVVAKK